MANHKPYSVVTGASAALGDLVAKCGNEIPEAALKSVTNANFYSSTDKGDVVLFPCPLKEQEAVAAIKGLESRMASAIAELRFGKATGDIQVDVMKVACFMASAYITTVDGLTKADESVKDKLPKTDLNDAQTILYRRLSAGLYQTKDEEYYHIHGSLEASKTLGMIGLPSHNPDLTDYDECIKVFGNAVNKHTVLELEEMNEINGQAGVQALTHEEFLDTPHGKTMNELPPFTVKCLENTSPKVPFGEVSAGSKARQPLEGVRVLELCRIIAGPTIGRSLAALGATVLKVTSPQLPDVPFFQVDGNLGKHTTSLHLKGNDEDRQVFEDLLESTDVIIDGYSPGSLDRLGYGPKQLREIAKKRGKGFVYVAEDCFGGTDDVGGEHAEWASRRGWQQIADCVTGVAWEQGKFMNKDEPVIPPFPMSDYGTGALGSVAALTGLYRRATEGGSWVCRTSLVQYDLFLLSLGLHTPEVQAQLREEHSPEFFELRYYDSVDMVGKRALESTNWAHANPFKDELMQTAWSPGFGSPGSRGAVVKFPREAVTIAGLDIGHVRTTRRNGFDGPSWEEWERDEDLLQGKNKPDPVEQPVVLN